MFLRDESARQALAYIKAGNTDAAKTLVEKREKDADRHFLQAMLCNPKSERTRRITHLKEALKLNNNAKKDSNPYFDYKTHLELGLLYNINGQLPLKNKHFTAGLTIFTQKLDKLSPDKLRTIARENIPFCQMILDTDINNGTQQGRLNQASKRAAKLSAVYDKVDITTPAMQELRATFLLAHVYCFRYMLNQPAQLELAEIADAINKRTDVGCNYNVGGSVESNYVAILQSIAKLHKKAIDLLQPIQDTRKQVTSRMLNKELSDLENIRNRISTIQLRARDNRQRAAQERHAAACEQHPKRLSANLAR